MFRIICLLTGYGFGCFQSAFILTKFKTGKDIRTLGSNNPGTANVSKVFGAKMGGLTFLLDFLKTIAAVLLCASLFKNKELAIIYAGLGVTLGHNFPIWLRFKGGKGVAVMIALLPALDWRVALLCFLTAGVVTLVTGYLAIGSIALAVAFPVLCALFGYYTETVLVCVFLGILMILRHITNLRRIRKGEEGRSAVNQFIMRFKNARSDKQS